MFKGVSLPTFPAFATQVQTPPEKIEDLQKSLAFPIKIIGTRKPKENWFWAWDGNCSWIFADRLNPYLYLTFQDKEGRVVGPIRYHSELNGVGLKLEWALRAQFGRLSGYEAVEFDSIPLKFTIEKGFDGVFGAFFAFNYSRVRFKDQFSPVLLQYFGYSTIGGYGGVSLKSGLFEAEEVTTNTGMPPKAERISLAILGLIFVVGLALATGPYISAYYELSSPPPPPPPTLDPGNRL